MNVSVFTIGRFHHFDLGRQLLGRGHGMKLFTSNPRSRVDEDLRRFTETHSYLRIPFAVGGRLGFSKQLYWMDELLLKDLGAWLARSLDLRWTDILHGLDGCGPKAGRILREHGKLWICDRGSTHIVAQRAILQEEYGDWNVPVPAFSIDRIERSVAEYEGAHAITVPSRFAKASFIEQGIDGDRVFVCPYGVNLSEFRPGSRKDATFRVIHVGQINVRKGIGHLLRAVEPLARKHKVELWLVGEIDPAARDLLDRFHGVFEYKGVSPRTELWRLYSQASVLVLASVEEGLALVQAQAMACGVPVIATRNTGAEDLFTDGIEGFIVPARSPDAIREKLEWMMDNPEACAAMGQAGIERVKSIGGWDHYGECVESVYRQLAARHGIALHQPD